MDTLRGRGRRRKHQHIYRKVPEISLIFRKTMCTANKLWNQLKIHLHNSSHHNELDSAKSVVMPIETYSFYFWKDTCSYEGRVLNYTHHHTDGSSLLSQHSFIGCSLLHVAIVLRKWRWYHQQSFILVGQQTA